MHESQIQNRLSSIYLRATPTLSNFSLWFIVINFYTYILTSISVFIPNNHKRNFLFPAWLYAAMTFLTNYKVAITLFYSLVLIYGTIWMTGEEMRFQSLVHCYDAISYISGITDQFRFLEQYDTEEERFWASTR